MNHLRLFESFNKVDIHNICKIYHIRNYTINENGYIDANGNVNLNDMKLTKLPLKFNNVNGYFFCSKNRLTSLGGSPKNVGDFFCIDNRLTSFTGGPEKVNGYFVCSNNNILTFEGFPKHIGGVRLEGNPIYEIWRLFMDITKIELFNDMDIIQDGTVILDRLNFFLEEIGRPTVKSIKGYKYI